MLHTVEPQSYGPHSYRILGQGSITLEVLLNSRESLVQVIVFAVHEVE